MKIVFTFCLLFSVITMHAQQSLTGIWNMGKDNIKIEITEDNDAYEGRIVSSDNTKAKTGNQLLKEVRLVGREWKGKLTQIPEFFRTKTCFNFE